MRGICTDRAPEREKDWPESKQTGNSRLPGILWPAPGHLQRDWGIAGRDYSRAVSRQHDLQPFYLSV